MVSATDLRVNGMAYVCRNEGVAGRPTRFHCSSLITSLLEKQCFCLR